MLTLVSLSILLWCNEGIACYVNKHVTIAIDKTQWLDRTVTVTEMWVKIDSKPPPPPDKANSDNISRCNCPVHPATIISNAIITSMNVLVVMIHFYIYIRASSLCAWLLNDTMTNSCVPTKLQLLHNIKRFRMFSERNQGMVWPRRSSI